VNGKGRAGTKADPGETDYSWPIKADWISKPEDKVLLVNYFTT
jgi:hypothetical protein